MDLFWTLLVLLVLLVLLGLHLLRGSQYLVDETLYMVRSLALGFRLVRYKKVRPFYSILDRFLDTVRQNPRKVLLVFEGQSLTYDDVDRQSNRLARVLQQHAGLQEGHTVALFLPNEPSYVWTFLALAKLGCPAALLNYNIRSRSLLHCFSCCGAKVLIACAELQAAVEEILPTLQEDGVSVFLLSDSSQTPGIQSLTDKIPRASDLPLPRELRANVTVRSTALYIYTSGTTGLPKAAVVTHERVWAASFIQAVCGVTSKDVLYVNLPLYHSAGFLIGLTGAIDRGVTVVLKRKFSASQFWNDCRKYNVTVVQYIGETMRYLCNTPAKDDDKDHKVRMAIGNGVRTEVWSQFLRRFGDMKVNELYGATEGNIGFINYTSRVGAVGRVNPVHKFFFPFTLIRFDVDKEEPIRDARGLCIPAANGEVGLLLGKVTRRSPFTGYAGNQQQTEKKRLHNVEKEGDLFFNTGDLFRVDEDNFVYFIDRVGDTFRWKGENVATSEVEDVLTQTPCVSEANVYGVTVEGYEGRVGMATVTLKEETEFDGHDAYRQVSALLPAYARPRFIRVKTSLDMTGTFKMKKVQLVHEGFDPTLVSEQMFLLDSEKKTFVPLTSDLHQSILCGSIKL